VNNVQMGGPSVFLSFRCSIIECSELKISSFQFKHSLVFLANPVVYRYMGRVV
jgi:hypothetical protein